MKTALARTVPRFAAFALVALTTGLGAADPAPAVGVAKGTYARDGGAPVAITHAAAFAADSWQPAPGPLMTQWAKEVSPTNALPEYPRPQLVRKEWQNLNGLWDYAITPKTDERPPASYVGKILVPYPIEAALSGVMKALLPEQKLWYRRKFDEPQAWLDGRIKLHFGRQHRRTPSSAL